MKAVLVFAAMVAAWGCATLRPEAPEAAEAPEDAAIVQVRAYGWSPTVNVVAWSPEDDGYGLRAMLRRDGTLVRDHRFYVNTLYLGAGFFRNPGLSFASDAALRGRRFIEMIAPEKQLLEREGISRDAHYCHGWPRCSPFETAGARVPDSALRASRDSIALRFYDRFNTEMILTLHRDVIDPYLRAVDSVAAALRKRYPTT